MAGSSASSAALDRQTCPGVRDGDGALPPERSEEAAAARHVESQPSLEDLHDEPATEREDSLESLPLTVLLA